MEKNKSIQLGISLKQKITLLIFGLSLYLVLLEVGLRLGGFIILSLQENRNRASFKQKGTYRIMCLGESTTAGQYPHFIEDTLNQHNIGIKFSVIDKGVPGTNTSLILARLESDLDAYQPDMVTAMMGINDQGSQISHEPVSDSKAINFLKSFRIYKLTRLLWLHIVTKFREIKSYKLSKHAFRFPLPFQEIEFKQVHTEETNSPLSEESLKLKKYIELNPANDEAYITLARLYREQGELSQAEELLKKYIELNPGNNRVYITLAWLYYQQDKFSQAEDLFKKAIKLNPANDGAYTLLAWLYQKQDKFSQAEGLLKKAIELNPGNVRAYTALAWLYREQDKFSQAEDLFKKAIELSPGNDGVYTALAWFYQKQDKFSQAEDLFKKAIKLNPANNGAYTSLVWLYRKQNKFSQAEELLKKYIELNPANYEAYGALDVLYEEMGNPKIARKYDKKAKELRLNYYNLITINNYHKLKEILDKRGIRLVCVQYPMRSIEPLKEIFESQDGVIFLDNEKIFKAAVKKDGYAEYFLDMFGGYFGHCTRKGNRLLAENIANVILKEVFGK